jgi:hypothetical protein
MEHPTITIGGSVMSLIEEKAVECVFDLEPQQGEGASAMRRKLAAWLRYKSPAVQGDSSMLKHRAAKFVSAIALVFSVGLMVPAVSMAATPLGSGPNDALAPTGTTQHLNVGQEHWYAFHSDGADRDNNPSQVFIQMNAQPAGSARFNVWSTERLLARQVSDDPNKDAPPVGEGTRVAFKDGDNTLFRYNGALVWGAGFKKPVTYYVQVQQTGSQPSNYQLSITGDAVTFPTAAPMTTASSASSESPAPVVLPATGTMQAGSSMSTALVPSGAQMTLKPDQQQWYKVQVPGTRDDTARPTILAELTAQPAGAAKFTVWTADRLQARAISADPNKDAPAIGAGTEQTYKNGDNTLSRFNGDLVWKGDARDATTYYIVVEPTGSASVDYRLSTTFTQ